MAYIGFVRHRPRVAPQNKDEPRLASTAPAYGCRPCPPQREDVPEEVPESHHGVAVAGESRVDAKYPVALKPDVRRREATHGGVGVEVYDRVDG